MGFHHISNKWGKLYNHGKGVPGGSGVDSAQMSAITTAPTQTVTLQRITPTGRDIVVDWGDSSTSTILNGNTGTTTHVYASTGTYVVKISNPDVITYIDLRDSKLVLGDKFLSLCRACTSLRIDISGFNSDHIKTMALTTLNLYLPMAGTYTFNSDHIKTMALTFLTLSLPAAGTYTFNSDHIKTMALTFLTLNLTVAGTYTFNSADIAARSTISNITAVLNTTTLTTTIAQADWDGFPACGTIRFEAGLSQAQVTAILLGLYDGFATKTVTGGTVDLLGTSNAAPTGVAPGSAQCAPTTGFNAAYELVNDSCGVSTKHWTSVTLQT